MSQIILSWLICENEMPAKFHHFTSQYADITIDKLKNTKKKLMREINWQ